LLPTRERKKWLRSQERWEAGFAKLADAPSAFLRRQLLFERRFREVAALARAWGGQLCKAGGRSFRLFAKAATFARGFREVAALARAWGGRLGEARRRSVPPSCEGSYFCTRIQGTGCARKSVGRPAWQSTQTLRSTFLRRQLHLGLRASFRALIRPPTHAKIRIPAQSGAYLARSLSGP